MYHEIVGAGAYSPWLVVYETRAFCEANCRLICTIPSHSSPTPGGKRGVGVRPRCAAKEPRADVGDRKTTPALHRPKVLYARNRPSEHGIPGRSKLHHIRTYRAPTIQNRSRKRGSPLRGTANVCRFVEQKNSTSACSRRCKSHTFGPGAAGTREKGLGLYLLGICLVSIC